MKIAISLLVVLTVLLFSCKTEQKQATDNTIVEEEPVEESNNSDREPTNDEIREYGIVTHIEDGQYPMFVVTIEFPERQAKADFNLNIEEIPQTTSDFDSLLGNYITVYYTDNLENMLMDIHSNGKTLYGEYAPEINDSYKSITGILSDAENETAGDLPTTITITEANGTKINFKEFITSEIAAKNGETITAYYYMRHNMAITYIKKSED